MKREHLKPARIAVELRAAAEPDDKRPANEVEMVAFSGAPIQTYDWQRGGPVELQFEMTDKACDLGRVRAGRAPLLLDHRSYSVSAVQGAVTDGWLEDGKLLLKARFSARQDAQAILADVKDKILNSVSMGAFLHSMKEITKDGDKVRRFSVTKWEPYEVSVVSVGADPGAGFLAASVDPPACEVVELNLEEQKMADTAMKTQAEIEAAAAEARKAEFARQKDLRGIADLAKVPAAMLTAWLDNPAMTPDQARAAALEHKAQAQDPEETPARPAELRMGKDARDKFLNAVEFGLRARLDTNLQRDEKFTDEARSIAGRSLLRIAEDFVTAAGGRCQNLTKEEIAFAALGFPSYVQLAGMHSTSDFPYLLGNVANKTLVEAYRLAAQTFRPFTVEGTLTDFKIADRVSIGGYPNLLKNEEGEEYQYGTIGEGKETVQLATYGRIVAVTRKTIVNDDLDGFARALAAYGAAISRLESKLVYEQITSNPTMGDGVALFHASHNNLPAGGAISETTLGKGRELMRLQKSIDGNDPLDLVPTYLLVPAALETVAEKQVVLPITANQVSATNPFGPGGRTSLMPIVEPRLDANSAVAWYLIASPSQGVRPMELLYLAGQRNPRVVRREGFQVDGVEFKVAQDVAAKALDWRAWVKNVGQ